MRLYTAMGVCNRCYGSAGSLWLLKNYKDLTLVLPTRYSKFCLSDSSAPDVWGHTPPKRCAKTPFLTGCSQSNGCKVLSPPSSSPGNWGVWLALFHKKATIFLDPNKEFLRRTGRAQPVCQLVHRTKLSSWLLMEHVAFPCKIQHPLQWYPFPFP